MSDTASIITLIHTELASQHMQRRYPEITADTSLIDDLACDGLDVMSIAVAVETAHGVEFSDQEIGDWRTVGDVVRSVEAGLAKVEG